MSFVIWTLMLCNFCAVFSNISLPSYLDVLVDLTYPHDENSPNWLDAQPFRFTSKTANSDLGFFYATNNFETGEHVGTHFNAPYHFNMNGWKVADVPVELLFTNGIKINAKKETAENPNYGLQVSKLEEWEQKNGKISSPTVVLVDFGWAKHYPNKNAYFGTNTFRLDDLHFPGLSVEAAEWIAKNKFVVGVGVDTPSVDTGENSPNPEAHILLNKASKYLLENVALNNVDLPKKNFNLFIAPMKIREGTGAPCRIIASFNKIGFFDVIQ